jgi:hypothetical protein
LEDYRLDQIREPSASAEMIAHAEVRALPQDCLPGKHPGTGANPSFTSPGRRAGEKGTGRKKQRNLS